MVKDQLNVLINLATSDRAVAEKEAKVNSHAFRSALSA